MTIPKAWIYISVLGINHLGILGSSSQQAAIPNCYNLSFFDGHRRRMGCLAIQRNNVCVVYLSLIHI